MSRNHLQHQVQTPSCYNHTFLPMVSFTLAVALCGFPDHICYFHALVPLHVLVLSA